MAANEMAKWRNNGNVGENENMKAKMAKAKAKISASKANGEKAWRKRNNGNINGEIMAIEK
jgi:hypothetical protein